VSDGAKLLPPNATPLERGLAAGSDRIAAIPTPLAQLLDPANCPLALLPWLAWALSVPRWNNAWSEARKRQAVASALSDNAHKGTRASIEAVLADYDNLLTVTEWWEDPAKPIPFSFYVDLPLDGAGGARATADFATALYADIVRMKNERSQFTLRQRLPMLAQPDLTGAARVLRRERYAATAVYPTPAADLALQTEDGEPIEGAEGIILEDH